MEDQEGKRYLFEIYNESGSVKGAKRDTKGTIIQGNHSYYRYVCESNSVFISHVKVRKIRQWTYKVKTFNLV